MNAEGSCYPAVPGGGDGGGVWDTEGECVCVRLGGAALQTGLHKHLPLPTAPLSKMCGACAKCEW